MKTNENKSMPTTTFRIGDDVYFPSEPGYTWTVDRIMTKPIPSLGFQQRVGIVRGRQSRDVFANEIELA